MKDDIPEAPKPKIKTKEKKVEFLVQEVLPTQTYESYTNEKGDTETKILLIPQALTEILIRLDRIERGIIG